MDNQETGVQFPEGADILPLPHSTRTYAVSHSPSNSMCTMGEQPDHEPHHSPLHWVPEQQSPE